MVGPLPDDADCCVMCLMRAKQRQYSENLPAIEAAWRDKKPDSNTVTVAWDPALTKMLRPGPYRGVCGDAPSFGIIGPSTPGGRDGLCWDHVAGLPDPDSPDARQLIQAAELPAGLKRR